MPTGTAAGSQWATSHPRQAEYDLERVIELFDEALTSKDERVINALRSLLMIVTLTNPEGTDSTILNRSIGPFRQMQNDLIDLTVRIRKLENMVSSNTRDRDREQLDEMKYQAAKMPTGIAPSTAYDLNLLKKLAGK